MSILIINFDIKYFKMKYNKSWVPTEEVHFTQVILHKLFQQLDIMLPTHEILNYEGFAEQRMRETALFIRHQFYGERIHKPITVVLEFKKPASPWQHFKEKYFSEFLLKKFPVEYITEKKSETIHFTRDFIFPKAQTSGIEDFQEYIVRDYSNKL